MKVKEHFETGENEHFDLAANPWQVECIHRALGGTDQLRALSTDLFDLKRFEGATCRQAENAP